MSEATEQQPQTSRLERNLTRLGVLILLVVLIGWLLPSPFDYPPQVRRKIASRHQLKDIGNAVFDEYDRVQTFPPGLTTSEDGAILHGLPTLLLPYLGEKKLSEAIDLNKPYWDEANQKVMQVDVEAFQNPMVDSRNLPIATMQYAFNVRVFPVNEGLQYPDLSDGTSNTIMGGEIADGIRAWYEPFHLRNPAAGLNKGPSTFGSPYFDGPDKKYYSGVQMLMLDGAVRNISDDIDPMILKALATPAAGDDVSDY